MSARRPPDQNAAGRPAELTHAEAENLISTRMDGPLDPVANRALMAHLAGCPSCRAFAARMDILSRGLRDLPHLPPSPTVSRQVRERIAGGQPAWARLLGGIGGGRWSPAPIAAAAMVLVAALAFVVITQMGGEEGGGRLDAPSSTVFDSRSATETATSDELAFASPTLEQAETVETDPTPTNFANVTVPTETATEEPTATATATATAEQPTIAPPEEAEPTSTATSVPTETLVPATATATATSEPTATSTPEPTSTATPEPTETPTEIPATPTEIPATPEPTETPTEEPTSTPTEEPTATATPEPTETPTLEPTASSTPQATETPTEEPTATATATPEPTSTSTPEPTATSTPEPTATASPIPTESLQIAIQRPDGQPLGGACFAVSGPTEVGEVCDNQEGDTDDDPGVIQIDDVQIGEYTVTETTAPEGHIAGGPETFEVAADAANEVTVQNVQAMGVLQVLTVDQNGDPVPDACYDSTGFGEVCDQDADGDMTLTEAPVGEYTVTQTQVPDGYAPSAETTQEATVATGETSVLTFEVELQPSAVVVAVIDEETDDPVGGACVQFEGPQSVEVCDNEDGDADDAEGTIDVQNLAPGDYNLTFSEQPEGFEEIEAQPIVLKPGEALELPLTLTPLPEPTETPTEAPTSTPTEEPTEEASPTAEATAEPTQPPIVPRGDRTPVPVEEPEEETTEEATDEGPTEETEPTILQTDGDDTPTAEPEAEETPTPEPTEEPPPTEEAPEAADLGDSEIIAPLALGPGVTDAPLAASPAGGLFAYYVNGGVGLAVGDFGGGAGALGSSMWPYWSSGGVLLFAYNTDNGNTGIAVWSGGTTLLTDGTDDEGTPVSDIPAGWIGGQLYYLREYADDSGRLELHSAGSNGEGDTVVWDSTEVSFAGQRPVATPGGVLIPTATTWLRVSGGAAREIDSNPYGAIGEAVLSPGGPLIAYVAAGQLIVASVDAPGTGLMGAPLPYPSGGFAWSPSGEQLVIADGSSLSIYANDGTPLGTVENASGLAVTAPYWDSSGIIFLEAAPAATIRRISPELILS